jgi:agmatinase
VDCGDQDVLYLDVERTFGAITDSLRKILSAKAFPVILGGDHSITFPVVRVFQRFKPLHLIHLDAHLDYNDSVEGVKLANIELSSLGITSIHDASQSNILSDGN